jgi:hypothetical protein
LVDCYPCCSRDAQELFLNLILNKLTEDNENVLEYCLIFFEISKASLKTLDYLVGKGLIGRFFENMVRKDPRVFVEKLETLPDGESEIGNEIVIERSEADTLKKMKFDNENGYLWALVNLTISRAKELETPLEQYITETEVSYFRLPDPKILKILEEIKSKM